MMPVDPCLAASLLDLRSLVAKYWDLVLLDRRLLRRFLLRN